MSIYSPLRRRLANAGPDPVTLTFEEIERLTGRPLPRSARDPRIRRQWWANSEVHVQARAWLGVGRRARLVAGADAVTFALDQDVRAMHETARDWKDDAPPHPVAETPAERRDRLLAVLEEMDRLRARTVWSPVSSVELIREDRDGR